MNRGVLCWLEHAGKKRPCIVLDVAEGEVVLIYGTRTARTSWPHVLVEPRTITGTNLGLREPTYFYASNVFTLDPTSPILTAAEIRKGACAFRVLDAIRAMLAQERRPGTK